MNNWSGKRYAVTVNESKTQFGSTMLKAQRVKSTKRASVN